jgi:hypothetical protein
MKRIAFAIALAVTAISTGSAFARPQHHATQVACAEDLGYGRQGFYGC